ncbi:hypothetical protein CTN07_20970 [Photobacterium damselae]|uniref:Uncharacterized protein n=1 Tax=Photobacterium damselae TaxID=38293 RepID=A0A2T3Q4C2_PHODM|nr:hypothetical protein CTN07_20970 [Photobacterium damselae]SPY45073.1 Uncharacterised protein [Photobacterium damselae]
MIVSLQLDPDILNRGLRFKASLLSLNVHGQEFQFLTILSAMIKNQSSTTFLIDSVAKFFM